jgi:sugar O-acyltransferase (sialic acid O-acetyltransferase NeuD family)
MENPVIILGAKGIGKVALDIFTVSDVIVYCLLDDDEALHNTLIGEISILGATDDDGFLKLIGQKCEVSIAIDTINERKEITERVIARRKVMPINAIHQKATISTLAVIGHGNIVSAGAVINGTAIVGSHNIVGSNAVIDTDAEIGNFCNIGAGVMIGTGVKIGDEVLIGTGAIIASGIKIGEGAQIAPGSLVMKNVSNGKTVFGMPAQEI